MSRARALVIEVTDEEGRQWTAMAHEEGGVLGELKNAPVAYNITIYEWHLAKPINVEGAFARCPKWVLIDKYPWRINRA